MEPISEQYVHELEAQAGSLKGEKARNLKKKVENALAEAESICVGSELVNRLDRLLIVLTEASRENVCTNTKCPHYDKKCKMR
jgi:HPt (histidine-containing phosphotransfer) domain-containing protein